MSLKAKGTLEVIIRKLKGFRIGKTLNGFSVKKMIEDGRR